MITVSPQRTARFDGYLQLFHWTELIQSSPLAVERAVYEVVGGAYRKNNVTTMELRFNPMKRNRGGEQDLDHIIAAAVRGMDKATLEYPVKPGLIFCLDRAFPYELNEIIAEKAIAWRDRGVVGIDIAGPEATTFRVADYRRLFRRARQYGLGLTVHTGESGPVEEVARVVELLEPDRIGHGVKAAYDPRAMAMIRERGIVLEICPTSNLNTKVVSRLGGVPLDLRHAPAQRGPVHDQHRRPGDAQDLHPRRDGPAGPPRHPVRRRTRSRRPRRRSRRRSCRTSRTCPRPSSSPRAARSSSARRPESAAVCRVCSSTRYEQQRSPETMCVSRVTSAPRTSRNSSSSAWQAAGVPFGDVVDGAVVLVQPDRAVGADDGLGEVALRGLELGQLADPLDERRVRRRPARPAGRGPARPSGSAAPRRPPRAARRRPPRRSRRAARPPGRRRWREQVLRVRRDVVQVARPPTPWRTVWRLTRLRGLERAELLEDPGPAGAEARRRAGRARAGRRGGAGAGGRVAGSTGRRAGAGEPALGMCTLAGRAPTLFGLGHPGRLAPAPAARCAGATLGGAWTSTSPRSTRCCATRSATSCSPRSRRSSRSTSASAASRPRSSGGSASSAGSASRSRRTRAAPASTRWPTRSRSRRSAASGARSG